MLTVGLRTQGFCYVKYSTPESAADAIEHLNGIEFPPNSNLRLKVGCPGSLLLALCSLSMILVQCRARVITLLVC